MEIGQSSQREQKILGCLLAGALGDALGAHHEGNGADSFIEVPAELRITDDTQLTLATCEALLDAEEVCPERISQSFLRWFRAGRITGIGSATLKALTELDAGGHWALVGATGERSAGNGAAMRIAPLAFVLDPGVDADRRTLRDVCRITHRNDEAYAGALAIVLAIRHLLAGGARDESLLRVLAQALPDTCVRDRLRLLCETKPTVREYADRFRATGYVADSVPLALLAAVRSADLMEGYRAIIACGGDTDTIASMFGQVFGAAEGVSPALLNQFSAIERADTLIGVAKQFAQRFAAR